MIEIIKKVIFLLLKNEQKKDLKKKVVINRLLASVVFIVLMSVPALSGAQTMEVGAFAGVSYYVGELNPGLPYNQLGPAYGAVARYNLNRRWALKLSYSHGKVQGSDATGGSVEGRDLDFQSRINDFSLVAEFNFWEYFTGSKRNYFTPFIYGGIGFFTFNPQSSDGVDLQPLGTEGQNSGFDERSPYNLSSFSIPFGIGVKYSVNERLALAMEIGMRKTFTDYIDDISTTYYLDGSNINPDIEAQLLSDPTMSHEPYMERGDQGNNDWLNFTGITITYKFDLRSKKGCNNVTWK